MGIGKGTKELFEAFGNKAVRIAFPLNKLVDEGITKVGVDATPWLVATYYKLEPHQQSDLKLQAELFKKDCHDRIKVLRKNKLEPVLVFDGNAPPLKIQIVELRAAISEAKKNQCAVAIPNYKDPEVRWIPDFFETIKWMKHEIEVEFIVAPYEADAQLTHLATTGYVHAVLTKDSDLIAFGCEKILYNTDFTEATCDYYSFARLTRMNSDYEAFSKKKLLEMLIIVGCDYMPNVIMYEKNLKVTNGKGKTQNSTSKTEILQHFERAILAFTFQQVYDPTSKTCKRLSQIDEGYDELQLDVVNTIKGFLGPYLKEESVHKIATGVTESIIASTDIDTRPEAEIQSMQQSASPRAPKLTVVAAFGDTSRGTVVISNTGTLTDNSSSKPVSQVGTVPQPTVMPTIPGVASPIGCTMHYMPSTESSSTKLNVNVLDDMYTRMGASDRLQKNLKGGRKVLKKFLVKKSIELKQGKHKGKKKRKSSKPGSAAQASIV
ncbi:PREDICTED: exonuclease 1-like [Fragaria vesca subsp. vesca]|uniref:exonuclease 1-like n=1 Tax=Fragaria vesca subsp. vesca TaxID=101020 RepID=UPI0002C2EC35|nr:PREDICTED: exonuclease 1-like [Fragaria vesca subsp. vesca]